MSDDLWDRVCALFDAARVVPASEREAVLARDPAVRADVQELLDQHDRSEAALATQVDLAAGAVLGSYRVDALLGTGGMGSVYLAQGPEGRVALKVLHPHLAMRPGFRDRFAREAALGRRVVHENVVRTLGVSDDGALVMEYVEGQTLDQLLQELGRVPEDLCRHIAGEVARGLCAIHDAGIVHRDLKPENVLITPEQVVKLMDFGVAFPQGDLVRLSQTGQFIGTIRYCAPEQVDGDGLELDGRADLYALGLVLYELASGQHPVASADLATMMRAQANAHFRRLGELNPQCSAFFEELVHNLLARSRDDRIPTAAALLEVITEGESGPWWSVRAHELERRTHRPLRRIRIPRDTEVHGREAELERIASTFSRVAQGRGQVLLVVGEAGIGKTRLIDEATTRLCAARPDVAVLFGSHPIGTASQGDNALREALRDFLGRAELDARLARVLADTPTLVPAFAAFLRGDAPPADAQPLGGGRLQSVLIQTVIAISRRQPTILVVDDLHLASHEGRDLFSALAATAADHPLLLVGTLRPGVPATWRSELERLDHVDSLELTRLGPKELSALLVDAFRSRRLAEQLGFRIAEKSDGNPYFVFEIVRALKEARRVVPTGDGSWTTAGALREVEVPATVREIIRARLSDLSDEEREILDVAACLGATFEPKLVAEAMGHPLVPVLRALGRMERTKRIVRAAGPKFVFDHHQVQETLYEQLSLPLREAYHAAIGDVLVARSAGRQLVGEEAMALCQHLAWGARYEAALDHLAAAYDHVWQRGLWDVGESLFRRLLEDEHAVAGDRRVAVLTFLAECHEVSAQIEAWRTTLEDALAVAEATGEPLPMARACSAWGWYLIHVSRLDAAAEAYERTRVLSRDAGYRRGEVSALGNLATVHFERGEVRRAIATCREYKQLVEEIEDTYGMASAAGNLGKFLYNVREYDEAERELRRHIEISESVNDRRAMGVSNCTLATIHGLRGDLTRARAHAEVGIALSRELGFPSQVAIGMGALATALFENGHWDEAQEVWAQCLQFSREMGSRQRVATALVGGAVLTRRLGMLDEAEARLREAVDLLAEGRAPGLRASARLELALVEVERGRVAEAARGFADVEAGGPLPDIRCLAALHGAEAHLLAGEPVLAASAYERALGVAVEVNAAPYEVEALCGLARCRDASWLRRADARLDSAVADLNALRVLEARHALWRADPTAERLAQAVEAASAFCSPMSAATRARALRHDPLLRALAPAG